MLLSDRRSQHTQQDKTIKNSKKMGSHQGLGEGRDEIGRAQRISKAMEILYNTIMVDIYYKFVQTLRMYIKS